MSQGIYIIDLQACGLPEPTTLKELWDFIEPRLEQATEVNPKFVELARRVTKKFPSQDMFAPGDPQAQDSVWLNCPVKEAQKVNRAAWLLGLASDQYWQVVGELVAHASALGLSLLNDTEGFGHLPGGKVIPPERQLEWEVLMEAVAKMKVVTPAQMRKKIRGLLDEWLAPHGFVPRVPPPLMAGTIGCVGYYQREVDDGWQHIRVNIRKLHDKFHCSVRFAGICYPVQAIVDAANARHEGWKYTDYLFALKAPSPYYGNFVSDDIPIETAPQRAALKAQVEQSVSYLDQMKNLPGLAAMLNERVDEYPGNEIFQYFGCTAVACAHLVGYPGIERLVQKYRPLSRHDSGSIQHMDGLLSHLGYHV